ncbi:hypothetical protein MNAN1_000913 [Malassezia nana]|uniref:Amino acid transporter transmembrane domain-containing protein n=1 Tax=Malassezia nana TaxID=180528 RepID=A0AAF0EJX8_9BASI|nr:hypothetical protein MNAN1_000913 [Malassezia nana]
MNLFSSSLHPGVLLAMPVYFNLAGILPGMIVLALVSLLGAFGGGLWVSLGRYVGGNTIEAITAKAFGMNTRWKRNIGYGISSLALVIYCTGAAVIAYHAMTDLLLQVFFHYSLPGQIFHDRAFVTLVIGGLLTLPLLLSTTPKRNMIQIQSWTVILFYPAIVFILLVRMGQWTFHDLWGPRSIPTNTSSFTYTTVPSLRLPDHSWPWASTAMLPLLTLSASPPQILAHNRSLQRKNVYDSNVTSFLMAQMIQVVLVLLTTYMVGVEVGVSGASKMLGGLHANFFSSMPLDDDYVNACRGVFLREEKEGEELRFLRSVETIGLIGAFVGFILPALIWLVLFRIRRPRAILMLQTNAMRRRLNQYLLSPLSMLIGKSSFPEEEPLLAEQAERSDQNTQAVPLLMPNHLNEHTSSTCDDATLVLLARKERDLQRKTRFRRRFQELLVVLALLPFGLLLIVMAIVELLEGGF